MRRVALCGLRCSRAAPHIILARICTVPPHAYSHRICLFLSFPSSLASRPQIRAREAALASGTAALESGEDFERALAAAHISTADSASPNSPAAQCFLWLRWVDHELGRAEVEQARELGALSDGELKELELEKARMEAELARMETEMSAIAAS